MKKMKKICDFNELFTEIFSSGVAPVDKIKSALFDMEKHDALTLHNILITEGVVFRADCEHLTIPRLQKAFNEYFADKKLEFKMKHRKFYFTRDGKVITFNGLSKFENQILSKGIYLLTKSMLFKDVNKIHIIDNEPINSKIQKFYYDLFLCKKQERFLKISYS